MALPSGLKGCLGRKGGRAKRTASCRCHRHRSCCQPGTRRGAALPADLVPAPLGLEGLARAGGAARLRGVAGQPLCLQLVILGNDCGWERSNVQLPQQGLAAVLQFGSKMSNGFDTPGGDQPHTHFTLFSMPVFLKS